MPIFYESRCHDFHCILGEICTFVLFQIMGELFQRQPNQRFLVFIVIFWISDHANLAYSIWLPALLAYFWDLRFQVQCLLKMCLLSLIVQWCIQSSSHFHITSVLWYQQLKKYSHICRIQHCNSLLTRWKILVPSQSFQNPTSWTHKTSKNVLDKCWSCDVSSQISQAILPCTVKDKDLQRGSARRLAPVCLCP